MKHTVPTAPRPDLRTRLAILADDFTGSNDTGAQFAKRGVITGVSLDPAQLRSMLHRFVVLAVDTESRFAPAPDAYQAVCVAVSPLVESGVPAFYKKIDSTVRGNLGSEIRAVLDTADLAGAVVCPALPQYGRTVQDGICLVDGTPIAETEFGRDPRTPVRASRIADIIKEQCSFSLSEIGLDVVGRGPGALAAAIEAVWSRLDTHPGIVVVDAVTEDDLATIAQSAQFMTSPPLLVGSSGLAAHLPVQDMSADITPSGETEGAGVEPATSPTRISEPKGAGVLLAIGSASATVTEQIRRACRAEPRLRELVVEPGRVHTDADLEQQRITERYLDAVRVGAPCLVRTERLEHGSSPAEDTAESLARFMGDLVRRLCHTASPSALVLSGGDTAIKAAVSLGCAGFSIEAEILPGIPIGRFIPAEPQHRLHDAARDRPRDTAQDTPPRTAARPPADYLERMRVVTKAGAFGSPDALLGILRYLEEQQS